MVPISLSYTAPQEASTFASQIAEQMKQKRLKSQYKSACVRASRLNRGGEVQAMQQRIVTF
jgi:hypothetical protein